MLQQHKNYRQQHKRVRQEYIFLLLLFNICENVKKIFELAFQDHATEIKVNGILVNLSKWPLRICDMRTTWRY